MEGGCIMAWSGNTSGFGLGPGLAGWFFIFIVGGFGIGEPAISIMFIMLLLVYGAFFLVLEYSWNEGIKETNQKIQKHNLEVKAELERQIEHYHWKKKNAIPKTYPAELIVLKHKLRCVEEELAED